MLLKTKYIVASCSVRQTMVAGCWQITVYTWPRQPSKKPRWW